MISSRPVHPRTAITVGMKRGIHVRVNHTRAEVTKRLEQSPVKQAAREVVLKMFVESMDQCDVRQLRCLSMPGLSWTFEHMLLGSLPNIRCIGIERDWDTMILGTEFMPGRRANHATLRTKHGDIDGARSENATVWNLDAYSMFITSRKSKGSRRNKKVWANEMKNNDAIWLDMSCRFGSKLADIAIRLHNYASPWVDKVPVALTFVGDEHDARRLASFLDTGHHRSWETCRVETYRNMNSNLCLLVGTSVLRANLEWKEGGLRAANVS